MVVQHNLPAMNANRLFGINNSGLSKSLEKLSSGYAINRAGDNAAGLAVSEKMRSQIAGLTQGVKNAEDGISMIQTYEGALTETDAILQRMKTLATQSANGTYQNDVDRDAIQLEFNQLNDELDQIADTDFNGVVMLNGGQMADGTKAVKGDFDYEGGTRASIKLGKDDVNIVADFKLNDQVTQRLSKAGGTATGAKTTKANEAWANLNATWTREPGKDDKSGPDSIDVTFKYDSSNNTWTAISASNGADKNKIFTQATENGGFSVAVGGANGTAKTAYDANDEIANVVVDTTNLKNGDTITLTINNPAKGTDAPTNAQAKLISDPKDFTKGTDTNAKSLEELDNVTVTLNTTNVSDAKMTEDLNALLEKLNGAQVDVAYKSDAITAAGDMTITFGKDEVYTSATASQTMTVGNTNFTLSFTGADNKLEIKSGSDVLATIQAGAQKTAAGAGNTLSSGTLSFQIAVEASKYSADASPSVEVAKTGSVSKANSNNEASAPLTYTDSLTLQAGARTKDSVKFSFEYSSNGIGNLKDNMNCSSRADGLGTKDLDLSTQESANAAIDKIDQAINKVSMVRATFGATQNRLEHKIDNMNVTKENITSAESRIRDTNMAEEMTNFTKNQILSQASQAMLAQANQLPQGVLQLLG